MAQRVRRAQRRVIGWSGEGRAFRVDMAAGLPCGGPAPLLRFKVQVNGGTLVAPPDAHGGTEWS